MITHSISSIWTGCKQRNMIHFILRMKLKMVMCVGILSLTFMFFTACIDVIANFANPEPKETSKMIDIINSDLKKVIHLLLFTYQCMILDLIMPIYAIFSASIKFRYCEKATKFEKNLPPFFRLLRNSFL